MVTYTIESILGIIGTVQPIPGRPDFGRLWQLRRTLIAGLKRITNGAHPNNGHAGYLMSAKEYALISAIEYVEPADVGEFCVLSEGAKTDTLQRNEQMEWAAKRARRVTFEHIRTALTRILEVTIDVAYHAGNTAMADKGFGKYTPVEVLQHLQQRYGLPSYGEIDQAMARLQEPMDRMQPIEVMLRQIEEVQMFLLASPEEGREHSDVTLIQYALIKLSKTGGMYTKALERWGAKPPEKRKTWSVFRKYMIWCYEKMLAENTGTTMGQEGYGAGGAFNAIADDDASTLAETIVNYAERATAAESKVSELESRLGMLEMKPSAQEMAMFMAPPATPAYQPMPTYQQPPPGYAPLQPPMHTQAAYWTPQQPTFQPPPPPAQQQWGQQPQQQQPQWTQNAGQSTGSRKRKKPRKRNNNMGFGHVPANIAYTNQQQGANQWNGGQQNNQQQGAKNTHTNSMKRHMNLFYCFTCGYDVDHPSAGCGMQRKQGHCDVPRDQAHLCPGASMVAQHKTMPDGTGAGKGWIMAGPIRKANFVMDQRETWWQKQNQQQQQQRRY